MVRLKRHLNGCVTDVYLCCWNGGSKANKQITAEASGYVYADLIYLNFAYADLTYPKNAFYHFVKKIIPMATHFHETGVPGGWWWSLDYYCRWCPAHRDVLCTRWGFVRTGLWWCGNGRISPGNMTKVNQHCGCQACTNYLLRIRCMPLPGWCPSSGAACLCGASGSRRQHVCRR